MADKKEDKKITTPAPTEMVAERPNRDEYSKMFAEDYPDVDFEDKEARYGKMVGDRKRLKNFEKSGKALGDVFDKNRGLAAMVAAAAEGQDPFMWARENLGMDFKEALENEEYAGKYAEAFKKYQEAQVKGEQDMAERESNLQASMQALQNIQDKTGISDDECQAMWDKFYGEGGIVDNAHKGIVSEDTWESIRKAGAYDKDIASAREEGGMQARNEKLQNPVKRFQNGMPPTLSQGTGRASKPRKKKEGFFDDLQDYH